MAGFKTHVTVSTLVGVGYGAAAYALYDVPLPTCIMAGGLCGVSGMLPDIDSGPGVPLRESLAFGAAVVSTMLVDRLQQFNIPMETILLVAAGAYLLVRFGMGFLLERLTEHRGMLHSLPAAAIAGELAFLLATGTFEMRCYKAGAVALGYLVHLVLDEIYSFDLRHGLPRVKKSSGTALKLFGRELWPNLSTYAKLGLLTYVIMQQPGGVHNRLETHGPQSAQQTATQTVERSFR